MQKKFWRVLKILLQDVELEQSASQIAKEIDFNLLYKRENLFRNYAEKNTQNLKVEWKEKLFVKIVIFANKFFTEEIFYDSHFQKLIDWGRKFARGKSKKYFFKCRHLILFYF